MSVPNSKHPVYDILPSTTPIIDYAIDLEKLSANGHFFVGAQIADRIFFIFFFTRSDITVLVDWA